MEHLDRVLAQIFRNARLIRDRNTPKWHIYYKRKPKWYHVTNRTENLDDCWPGSNLGAIISVNILRAYDAFKPAPTHENKENEQRKRR